MFATERVLFVALAALGMGRLWFHGSIFADWRERAQSWAITSEEWEIATFGPRCRDWFSRLLGCSMCFTAQAAVWLGLLAHWYMLPIFVLAGVYVADWLRDAQETY